MDNLTLTVAPREERGRGPCRRLRATGFIPVVYYGKDVNHTFSIEEKEFRAKMRIAGGHAGLVQLQPEGGEELLALIKEMQRDPVTDAFLHIDFIQVTRGQELQAKVPLLITGEAIGVKNEGGIIEVLSNEIEVRCRPSLLPDKIELDVGELDLGSSLTVADLPEIEGVNYVADATHPLVSCVGSASGRAALDDEEGAEVAEEGEEGEGETPATDEPSDGEESPADETDSSEA